jgi:hypothetical protein
MVAVMDDSCKFLFLILLTRRNDWKLNKQINFYLYRKELLDELKNPLII